MMSLPDKTLSGVAGRQRSNACQMRLEHQGLFLQPVDLGEFLGAPGGGSDEIRNLQEEALQMARARASDGSQTQ